MKRAEKSSSWKETNLFVEKLIMFQQEELYRGQYEELQGSVKFIRRRDISSELRLHIACTALYFNDYGIVTKLAKKHKISRTFIYILRRQLELSGWAIFGMLGKKGGSEEVSEKLDITKEILSLRLEGKCPILGISQLLKRKGISNNSIGYISELLNGIGEALSPTISLQTGVTYGLVFASDEVFSNRSPVLITVDPVSSVILRMELAENRKCDSWEEHWQSLLDIGVVPLYLTSDEGSGMKAAREKIFPNLRHQTDTFHAIAYRLGEVFRILEQQTYATISDEYACQKLLQSSKSKPVSARRFAKYHSAKAKAADFINLYEEFSFWYEFVIDQFQIFDDKGQLFQVQQAKKNLELGIQEIEKLNWFFKTKNEKMEKIIATIKNLLPKLLPFLAHAKKVVDGLLEEASCTSEHLAIQALCTAYQFRKNRIKTKHSKSKKYFALKEEEELVIAQILLESTSINIETLHKKVYLRLATIIQSSAMVETINSIVRSYFNVSKNHINQAQLNLISFYHNHRRYIQGERKGYTPMELLTGQEQKEDWLDLMLQQTNRIAA